MPKFEEYYPEIPFRVINIFCEDGKLLFEACIEAGVNPSHIRSHKIGKDTIYYASFFYSNGQRGDIDKTHNLLDAVRSKNRTLIKKRTYHYTIRTPWKSERLASLSSEDISEEIQLWEDE